MLDLRNCKVLAVDDSESNIDIIVNTIGDLHDLSVALNGPSALELIDENIPDIVLLDIMMPGMNGFEVMAELRKKGRIFP